MKRFAMVFGLLLFVAGAVSGLLGAGIYSKWKATQQAAVEEETDDIASLRGRIVALEEHAERVATTIADMALRLPPPPAKPEAAIAAVAGIAEDIGDVVLPFTESAGDRAAPPLMVLMDPHCPYCRAGHKATMAIAAEGKARVVYIPIGLLGPDSQTASIAILAMARLDPHAAASLIERLFEPQRANDTAYLDASIAAELEKIGRTADDYRAAVPAGQEAHARILKAYGDRKANSGIPVYVRFVDGKLRGMLGFAPDGSGETRMREQLGF